MAGHVSRGWERQEVHWFGEQFETIAVTQEGMVSGSEKKEENSDEWNVKLLKAGVSEKREAV